VKDQITRIAQELGELCAKKNKAYGDSFRNSGKILEVLWPDGVPVSSYRDMLAVARVVDKLGRIATDRDALGESPWRDICGYAILGSLLAEEEPNNKQPTEDREIYGRLTGEQYLYSDADEVGRNDSKHTPPMDFGSNVYE